MDIERSEAWKILHKYLLNIDSNNIAEKFYKWIIARASAVHMLCCLRLSVKFNPAERCTKPITA